MRLQVGELLYLAKLLLSVAIDRFSANRTLNPTDWAVSKTDFVHSGSKDVGMLHPPTFKLKPVARMPLTDLEEGKSPNPTGKVVSRVSWRDR